jgi:hypothetical protein
MVIHVYRLKQRLAVTASEIFAPEEWTLFRSLECHPYLATPESALTKWLDGIKRDDFYVLGS